MKLSVMQLLPALNIGGVERETMDIARALNDAGLRALVVSGGGQQVGELEACGGEHIEMPVGRKSPFSLRYVKPLHDVIMQHAPDIVHARSRLPAWLAWRALQRIPAGERPRFVTTIHGLYSVNRYSAIMTRGERIICVSEAARRYVLDNYPGTQMQRLVVIPRGVDREEFPYGYRPTAAWRKAWQRRYPQFEGRQLLTLAGRVNRRKGLHTLIELLAGLRARGLNVQGVVAGPVATRDRRYVETCVTQAERAGVGDRLSLIGPRQDLRDVLCVSDLLVSLSEKPEAFGRTVTEALSLGRPVLGWDHGGVGEQLQAVYPAGAVPLKDLGAMVDSAEQMLRNPPLVPKELPYTLDRMQSRTLALYESLARGADAEKD